MVLVAAQVVKGRAVRAVQATLAVTAPWKATQEATLMVRAGMGLWEEAVAVAQVVSVLTLGRERVATEALVLQG